MALILGTCFTSCYKDPDIPTSIDTIIGKWEVIQIDSVMHGYGIDKEYWISSHPINDTCSVEFFPDSTGQFSRPFRSMIGTKTTFKWYHEFLHGRIYFTFDSLNMTFGVIAEQKTNDLELYVQDYLGHDIVGGNWFYDLKMIRK